jgi:hypothetical protein
LEQTQNASIGKKKPASQPVRIRVAKNEYVQPPVVRVIARHTKNLKPIDTTVQIIKAVKQKPASKYPLASKKGTSKSTLSKAKRKAIAEDMRTKWSAHIADTEAESQEAAKELSLTVKNTDEFVKALEVKHVYWIAITVILTGPRFKQGRGMSLLVDGSGRFEGFAFNPVRRGGHIIKPFRFVGTSVLGFE